MIPSFPRVLPSIHNDQFRSIIMKYVKSEVPTMDDFMRPILEYANQRSGSFKLREITYAMSDHFKLSAEARAELTGGGNIDRVYDRTSWSISHLKHAELLRQVGRGRYEITDAGRKEAKSSNDISVSWLIRNVPAYQRWKQSRTSRKSHTSYAQESRKQQGEQIEGRQNMPVSAQISQLWQLKQEGAITQEEFEKQKAKLLQS